MASIPHRIANNIEDERKGEREQLIHKDNGCGLSARHTMVVCLNVGLGLTYFLRFNLSVAMVAMVTNNNMAIKTSPNITNTDCPRIGLNTTTTNKTTVGEFDWDPVTQGLILSAFFYGYCILQIPGAWLATRYGPKRLIGSGVFLVSVLSMLTPIAARTSIWALIALRAMQGLTSGYLLPCVLAIVARWAPVNERAKLISLQALGVHAGMVATFMGTGWLCEQSFLGGWPAAFYIPGVAGCIWCVFWAFLAYDSPSQHPRITKTEYHLIMDSVGENVYDKRPVPWIPLLTSRPFWAVCVAHTCGAWGTNTLMTELPSYMKNVIGVDVKESGFLSSLPYLASMPAALFWGFSADTLRKKNVFKVTMIRKILNTVGTVAPAGFLLLSTFIGCNEYAVIALISAATVMQLADIGASSPNMIDLAPHLAGLIKSVCNTFATLSGIVSPYLSGYLVNDGETKAQWSIVFYISAGVFLVDTVYYWMFASSDLQPWATGKIEVEVRQTNKQTNEHKSEDNISGSSDTHVRAGNIQGQ